MAVQADPQNNVAGSLRKDHTGSAEITFTLHGAVFDANVTALMFDRDGPAKNGASQSGVEAANICTDNGGTDVGCDEAVVAAGTVASIVSGGRKGDASITIEVAAATVQTDDAGTGAAVVQQRDMGFDTEGRDQTISFAIPRLAKLALAGANITDANDKNDVMHVRLHAESRIVSGAFTDGRLTGIATYPFAHVVSARDSVTVSMTDGTPKAIAIDGDDAFKSVKGANDDGYVKLGTVTIMTKQVAMAAMTKVDPAPAFTSGTTTIMTIGRKASPTTFHELFDLDGEPIDEGLRGAFSVSAMGTRDLFNDGDMLFVDYDGNGKKGPGEEIAIDGDMGMGDALSIDPDQSESFNEAGTGTFNVFYMAGGKDPINHGSAIKLTAMVDYSDPSAIDETPAGNSTTLNFDGVGSPVRAYAIPHSTNGTGDKGNVRVRCEASAGCRVFLECWDDMGMRGFGEAPMIAGNSVMVWNGEAIEGVTGMEPTSRHSCRVLSKGMVTVQQLTRDGNSGTLVNNTYIGGGM